MSIIITEGPRWLEGWLRLVLMDDSGEVIVVRYVRRPLIIADGNGAQLPPIRPSGEPSVSMPA